MGISNTVTLQATMNWAQWFLGQRPLALPTSSPLEPALTSANLVVQTVMQPPFRWKWNRNTTTLSITTAAQDYLKTIVDFGFIEKVSLTDGSGKIYEIP